MKVSLLTVVFNCSDYIEDCIRSVISQDYENIEYIIIDGGSTDGTAALVKLYHDQIAHFVSERDQGMYEALNKGLAIATGDLVGLLHADDLFASNDVISSVVRCFRENDCDIAYGNLNFISRKSPRKVTRRWRSKQYKPEYILKGWMPAHPTMYAKRNLIIDQGCYSLKFGQCADYELILRILHKSKLNVVFLDKLMVLMRNGGMSNGSLKKAYRAMINDYKALTHNKIPKPFQVLLLKRISKLSQLFVYPNTK